MAHFDVVGSVTISISCEVEADNESAAIERAEELPLVDLCHECAGGDPTEFWVTSGELDGMPKDLVVEGGIKGIRVVYMAHPVSGDIEGNLAKARAAVRRLEESHKNVAIVASWITECEVWDDSDEEQRAAGLRRDMAVLSRCDELWLVGPHVSDGMAMEANHAAMLGIPITDMTGPGQ